METLKVLISRIPTRESEALASDLGLELVGAEALKIKLKKWKFSKSKSTRECWVISSKNALDACLEAYGKHSKKCQQVECIGLRTAQKLIDAEMPLKHIGANADELLHNHAQEQYDTIRFFCGTSRRDTIPDRAAELGVNYIEQIVYDSKAAYPNVKNKGWDGIIFTSPLAAQSLVKNNKLDTAIPCIAMGKTTAKEVRNLGFKTVLVPKRPALEVILKEFNKYLRP